MSTVRTPYGGLDEWTRIVIVLGGCALTGVAALLAFAPRRGGAFGVPVAAAVALGALYTLPVMQHDIRLPYLAGLLFALLLAAFLWLERVSGAAPARPRRSLRSRRSPATSPRPASTAIARCSTTRS